MVVHLCFANCIYPFNFGDLSNLGHIKKIFFFQLMCLPFKCHGKKRLWKVIYQWLEANAMKFVSSVRFANVVFLMEVYSNIFMKKQKTIYLLGSQLT